MNDRDRLCVNTLRMLAVDMVEEAGSGHPGLPLGAAPMAYVLWDRFLRHDPRDPSWPDRDRFVLSAGHGCALLYALLHMTGYDLPLDELRRFRQWGSRTPGHPEYRHTPGVEATTGPLGQGFAMGVGMAMAEAHLARIVNRPDFPVVAHHTYGIVSDGDLMEGISSEAASLAGRLALGRLIYLYDDNHISIEGDTDLAFTEDVRARFDAYGWQTLRVHDGNDLDAIDLAIRHALADRRAPVPDPRAQPHRLRQPQAGLRLRPRRAARRGGDPGDQGEARLALEPHLPGPRRGARPPRIGRRARRTRRTRSGARWSRRSARAIPTRPPSIGGSCRASFRRDGTTTLPVFSGQTGRDAGRLRPDVERPRRAPSRAGRRLGRPGAVDEDPDRGRRGLRPDEARRAEHPLRRPRTRDGRMPERPRPARRTDSLRGDLPHLLGLHAPVGAPGRPDADPRDLRLHARQHRPRRGRPDPSTGRAAHGPARDPRPHRHPSGGRKRDRGGVAVGRGAPRARSPWC